MAMATSKRHRYQAETAASFSARQASAKQWGTERTRKPRWVYVSEQEPPLRLLEQQQAAREAAAADARTREHSSLVSSVLREMAAQKRENTAALAQLAARQRDEQVAMLQHEATQARKPYAGVHYSCNDIVDVEQTAWLVVGGACVSVCEFNEVELLVLQNVAGKRVVRRADEVVPVLRAGEHRV